MGIRVLLKYKYDRKKDLLKHQVKEVETVTQSTTYE